MPLDFEQVKEAEHRFTVLEQGQKALSSQLAQTDIKIDAIVTRLDKQNGMIAERMADAQKWRQEHEHEHKISATHQKAFLGLLAIEFRGIAMGASLVGAIIGIAKALGVL